MDAAAAAASLHPATSITGTTICEPPFGFYRDKRRNLIKKGVAHCPRSAQHKRMCDAKSHCSSRSLTTDVASQESGSPWMIDSSIFAGAIQQKDGMRRGHLHPLSWRRSVAGGWIGEIKKYLKDRRGEDKWPGPPFIGLAVHHCHGFSRFRRSNLLFDANYLVRSHHKPAIINPFHPELVCKTKMDQSLAQEEYLS